VWFESWDDAVAAWLDAALRWPAQHVCPPAWFWLRIARMAGLSAQAASAAFTHTPVNTSADVAAGSRATDPARAMLARWQADPVSQRASSEWLSQRPALRACLLPQEASPVEPSQVPDTQTPVGQDVAGSPAKALARPAEERSANGPAEVEVTRPLAAATHEAHRTSDFSRRHAAVKPHEPSDPAPASVAVSRSTVPGSRTRDAVLAASQRAYQPVADAAKPIAAQQPAGPVATSTAPTANHADNSNISLRDNAEVSALPTRFAAPAQPTVSAMGWTQLRRTQLGGLPFTINALQGLGFAGELDAASASLDPAVHMIAASAPWLAVWAGLSPAIRQRWMLDPMFAVLPAFDALAEMSLEARECALLISWQSQAPSIHDLGRRMWRRLHRVAQTCGWRSPRMLLQRAAWMQLDATHLDVIFSLDQADLSVRRLGLDTDPGWVPWLGRIVRLHFEPANELPPHLPHRSTP
jgi:hypothetical protein